MPAVALIVAAGRGERLGSTGPKAFVMCGGRPLVQWSVDALLAVGEIEAVVVALPPGTQAPAGTIGVQGGDERSHSVRNALVAAPADADVVIVHDAARPLVTPSIVRACVSGLAGGADAAIAAAPVSDTVKEGSDERVVRTLDRSRLWAVQTPQVFRRAALEAALAQGDDVLAAATDDASLVEAAGGTVRLVETTRWNLKVTTHEDLRVAELLLTDKGSDPLSRG
jgi:2-C-methyl-D-erythritol 4-phosphate cytidylyltransferase